MRLLSLLTRRLLFGWGLWLALAFTVAYVFGGQWLVGLLTNDATVRTAAGAFAWWTWLIPLAGFAAFVYDGIFIGLTATRGMLLSSATASAAFFVILGTVLLLPSRVQGSPVANHMLWLAFIVYLALRGAIQHVLIRRKGIATTP